MQYGPFGNIGLIDAPAPGVLPEDELPENVSIRDPAGGAICAACDASPQMTMFQSAIPQGGDTSRLDCGSGA